MIVLINLYGVLVFVVEMVICMCFLGVKNILDFGLKYVSYFVFKDICGSRVYRIMSGEVDMDVFRLI